MPKSVDIYVLDKKIGSGQFGDVYKGYSKIDGNDVAIKTIRRDKIKGKFTQLLQNQIQVLRSCKNNNVIRLIDIKKTSNNIYLILQFCNEGDLQAFLKQKKKIPEQQAVQYFVQILHAFQTLVKSKIMHRDFKLANVLKHNGCIKIADFGFAKLLGSEDQQVETILGSPLNMAPQVLDRQAYNSKADIWSIGVGFYQLVFGKVPFTASNIIDLLKKIKKEPVQFPYKVHPAIQDVIRKMLIVDPNKRIQWNALFKHPVTRMLQQQIEDNLQKSMLCQKSQLPIHMSKFYIKANKVIENVNEISKKKELNTYIKDVIKNKEANQYKGPFIKRNTQRNSKQIKESQETVVTKTEKQIKQEDENAYGEMRNLEEEKISKMKRNCKIVLSHRNMYAFLGHLAQDLIEMNLNIYAECLSFLLVKQVIEKICQLKQNLSKKNLKQIQNWNNFQTCSEYHELSGLIATQQQIFNRFYEKLSLKVLEAGTLQQFQQNLMISGKFTKQQTRNRIYHNVLKEYIIRVDKDGKINSYANSIHILKILDSLKIDFQFNDEDFDFGKYYQQFSQSEQTLIKNKCKSEVQKFLKKVL